MLELIRFASGNISYFLGLVRVSPWLVGYKLGIIKPVKAKEKLLSAFFQKMPLAKFNECCDAFAHQVMPRLIRPSALKEIYKHQMEGTPVVVVTASAENWVSGFCRQYKLDCLATQLEVDENEKLTGKVNGENCNNAEKVCRIKEKYDPAQFEKIYVYGDSKGDKEMLALATHPYYRYFTD